MESFLEYPQKFLNHRLRYNSNTSLQIWRWIAKTFRRSNSLPFFWMSLCDSECMNLCDLRTTLRISRHLRSFLLGTCLTVRTFNNQIDHFTSVVCNERCYTEHWSVATFFPGSIARQFQMILRSSIFNIFFNFDYVKKMYASWHKIKWSKQLVLEIIERQRENFPRI